MGFLFSVAGNTVLRITNRFVRPVRGKRAEEGKFFEQLNVVKVSPFIYQSQCGSLFLLIRLDSRSSAV